MNNGIVINEYIRSFINKLVKFIIRKHIIEFLIKLDDIAQMQFKEYKEKNNKNFSPSIFKTKIRRPSDDEKIPKSFSIKERLKYEEHIKKLNLQSFNNVIVESNNMYNYNKQIVNNNLHNLNQNNSNKKLDTSLVYNEMSYIELKGQNEKLDNNKNKLSIADQINQALNNNKNINTSISTHNDIKENINNIAHKYNNSYLKDNESICKEKNNKNSINKGKKVSINVSPFKKNQIYDLHRNTALQSNLENIYNKLNDTNNSKLSKNNKNKKNKNSVLTPKKHEDMYSNLLSNVNSNKFQKSYVKLRGSIEPNNNKNINYDTIKEIYKNPNNELFDKSLIKEKLLRVGDIVIIRFNEKLPGGYNYESILTPELMISKAVFCTQTNFKFEKGNSIYKRALFRIENSQSYLKQNQLELAKKELLNKELINSIENMIKIEELQKKANDEKKGNESEYLLNFCNEVTYGQMIQLKNIFTNELLVTDKNIISKEIGCLDVSLSKLGGQCAWFKLKPADKIRQEGDVVSYSDNFLIQSCATDTDFYLHVNTEYNENISLKNNIARNSFLNNNSEFSQQLQVNLSFKSKIFNISLFESALDCNKNKIDGCIKNTDYIRLYNNCNNAYLTVSKENIKYCLPTLYYSNNDEHKENANDYIDPEKRRTNFNVYFETDINLQQEASTYWEIQYYQPEIGINLKYKMLVRLRNLSTGYFIAHYQNSNNIILSKNGGGEDTLFYIFSDKKDDNLEENELTFNSQINLMAFNSRFNMNKKYLSLNSCIKNTSRININLSDDPYRYNNMVFKIEEANNTYSKFSYNIYLGLEHLIKLYNKFNEFGIKKVTNQEYSYDYNKSLENKSTLKYSVELYEKILNSINVDLLENKPGSLNYKKLQDFYAEQGMLTLLLIFVRLFDLKSIIPFKKENIYFKKKEHTPYYVFESITKEAVLKTFNILLLLIRENSYSCKKIYKDLIIMSVSIDSSHQLSIMKIIFACFESAKELKEIKLDGTTSIYSTVNFWKDMIEPINENYNIEQQTFYLKILSMLCIDGKENGITSNQTEVKIKLFERDNVPIKFGLEDETIAYFTFQLPKNSINYEDFLKNNPSLRMLFKNEKFHDLRTPKFYYDSLSSSNLKAFLNYICAVLDLYEVVCRSRNENLMSYITGPNINLTPEHMWSVMYDFEIPIVIRSRMLKLIRTLLVDVDYFYRITEFRNRCYKWEDININNMIPYDKEVINQVIINKLDRSNKNNVENNLIEKNIVDNNNNNVNVENFVEEITNNKNSNEIEIYKLFKWYEINEKDTDYLKEKELIIEFILNFWLKKFKIIKVINLDSFERLLLNKDLFLDLMQYLQYMFEITKEMCDFGYFCSEELKIIMIGVAYFFSIFETYKPKHEEEVFNLLQEDNKKSLNIKNHWLSYFATLVLDSDHVEIKSKLFKLYETSINILNIIVIVKEDLQLLYFLKYFKFWNAKGDCITDTFKLTEVYFNILSKINFFKFEIEDNLSDDLKISNQKANLLNKINNFKSSNFFQNNNNISNMNNRSIAEYNNLLNKRTINEQNQNDFNENNNLNLKEDNKCNIIRLDMYLLGVLFNDYDNDYIDSQLDKYSMSLLVKYFNEIEFLKQELSTVELIITKSDIDIYEQILETSTKLKDLKYKVINTFIENNLKLKGLKQDNNSLVNDIVRYIENELISKLNYKEIKKFFKVQNIMRHLKIHEILFSISDSLEKFDKSLIIYNYIYKFLYLFSYKNYHNQVILKNRFDYLLERLESYKNIGEILIEILNVYKTSPIIIEYINKIFYKIDREKKFSADVAEVLRSITIDYEYSNISINQELIFKKLINNKQLIKFYFNIDKKELLETVTKIKLDKSNKTIFNSLNSKLKIIELLSFCSKDNLFCTMNCRRLSSLDDIISILIDHETPYYMKPTYLEYLYNVYYINLSDRCKEYPINKIYDLLKEIQIELSLYNCYYKYFIDVYRKFYDNLTEDNLEGKKRSEIIRRLEADNLNKIKNNEHLKIYLINDGIDVDYLGKFKAFNKFKYIKDNKYNDYWKFIFNKSSNSTLPSQGVLPFLRQILFKINRYLEIDTELINIILGIKKLLLAIMSSLSLIEEELGNNDLLTEIQYELHLVFSTIPKLDNYKIINDKYISIEYLKKKKKKLIQENNYSSYNITDNMDQEIISDIDIDDNNKKKKKSIQIQDHAMKVLNEIKKHIKEYNTNINDIFNLLDTDQDKELTNFEFSRNLKKLLGNKLTHEEIENALLIIDANNDNKISLREFSIKLIELNRIQTSLNHKENKEYYKFIKVKDSVKTNDQNIDDFVNMNSASDDKSYKIKKIFQFFVINFNTSNKVLGHHNEISSLVNKLHKFLEESSEDILLEKFIKQLEESFNDNANEIYLLKILSELINSKFKKINFKEDVLEINNIQCQLNSAGVTLIAINLIKTTSSLKIIEEALNLLILMLKFGNYVVQKTIFDYLQNEKNSFNFFSYIRQLLHTTYKDRKSKLISEYEENSSYNLRIQKKQSLYKDSCYFLFKPINSCLFDKNFNTDNLDSIERSLYIEDQRKYFRVPIKIIWLLQLFCENCFEPFQHFIREQDYYVEDKDKVSSINIVYEIGNFLISLLNFGQKIYSDKESLMLISQCLLTLADFCLGPCETNQLLLGTRRTLHKALNNLLIYDIKFSIKERFNAQRNKIFCKVITFLKSLINPNNIKEIGQVILEEIEPYLLIEKLIDIHQLKILPNISNLISSNYCDHPTYDDIDNYYKVKVLNKTQQICSENFCFYGKLTKADLEYIKIGFDIFIILTYLVEAFPHNNKLQLFKLKLNKHNYNEGFDLNTVRKKKEVIKNNKNINIVEKVPGTIINNEENTLKLINDTNINETNLNISKLNIDSKYKSNNKLVKFKLNTNNQSTNKKDKKSFIKKIFCCLKKNKVFNSSAYLNSVNNNNQLDKNINKHTSKILEQSINNTIANSVDMSIAFNDDTFIDSSSKHKAISNLLKKNDESEEVQLRFYEKYFLEFKQAYIFYAENVSNVEISFKNTLIKTYFPKPFMFNFFSEENKKSLIWDSKYDNHQARLEEIFSKIDFVKVNLIHNQKLGSYRITTDIWKFLSYICLILALTLNIIYFLFIKYVDIKRCYPILDPQYNSTIYLYKDILQSYKNWTIYIEKLNELDSIDVLNENLNNNFNNNSNFINNTDSNISNLTNINNNTENNTDLVNNINQNYSNTVLFDNLYNFKDDTKLEDLNIPEKKVYLDCVILGYNKDVSYTYGDSYILKLITEIITYIMLVLYVFTLLLYILSNYPLMLLKAKKNSNRIAHYIDEYNIKKYSGTVMFFIVNNFLNKIKSSNDNLVVKLLNYKVIAILSNPLVIKFIFYIFICVLMLNFNPLFGCIILIEIVFLVKNLHNILIYIIKNTVKLLSVFILLTLIIYVYTLLAFYFFRKDFSASDYSDISQNIEYNLYCDTIKNCFFSILTFGLRIPGGIGMAIKHVGRYESDYWYRYAFDLSFYIIVVLIILNIILSIIIESFNELRNFSKIKSKSIRDSCLICSLPKYKFEVKGEGWNSHYKYEHNIFSYLYYIVYLESKDLNDCDGLEKYVRNCLTKKDLNFIPFNEAMSLQIKNESTNIANLTINSFVNSYSNY